VKERETHEGGGGSSPATCGGLAAAESPHAAGYRGLRAGEHGLGLSVHRIIERFGLEGTLKIIWFQPPCHEQGHLSPDQVAQSSVQPGLVLAVLPLRRGSPGAIPCSGG